ncbi:MAG: cobalamin-binding protein [Acidimicrobiia bacterium]
MKIVSLIPSATEIVFALGLGDSLDGVTFECDYPPDARTKPVVSGTALPTDESLTAKQIDDAVSARVAEGEAIYTLDAARIRDIQPDLILAQDLCQVCAVPSGAVEAALEVLGCRADVISLDPSTLDEVIDCIAVVGDATGTGARARVLVDELRSRVGVVSRAVGQHHRPRTFALEWSDPPFSGGHWVPDMIDAAGGTSVLAVTGEQSRRLAWDEVAEAAPDIAVFMPCGYGFDQAVEEGRYLLDVPALAHAEHIFAADANALFSRPGPRLVDGVEALAWALHPRAFRAPPPGVITALR